MKYLSLITALVASSALSVTAATKSAEITVNGGHFKDGKSQMDFVAQDLKTYSKSQTITVENTGRKPLKNISVVITGAAKSNFKASSLRKTILSPGSSMTFTVKFRPTQKAPVFAKLQILSNDKDENPFDIKLKGESKIIIDPFAP
jgi:hypothetical protein